MNVDAHWASSASFIASSNESIPQGRFAVNRKTMSARFCMSPNPGAIKITANHVAERLVSNSERIFKRILPDTVLTIAVQEFVVKSRGE